MRIVVFDKNLKYKDIFILAIVAFIGYKIVDNYTTYFAVFNKLLTLLSPFIYALIFAYVLNPLMKLFEKRFKLKRGAAVGATYVLVAGILIIAGIYVIPSLIDSIISITKDVPSYVETVQEWVNSALQNDKVYDLMKDAGVLKTLTSLSTRAGTILISMLEGAAGSLLSITADIVMIGFGFLTSIYVLLDKERFISQAKTLTLMVIGKKRGMSLINALRTYNHMIGVYIGIKAVDSTIIGLMALVGLLIFKVPYAILIAIVVGFTNMIPYFGPFIGELVGTVAALFISPTKALIVFIFLLALQQFDAWYLDPKLIGNKVGVRPFLIILGVTVCGGFFGALGMLLASPTIATIKIYYDRRVKKFKEDNKDIVEEV